jgi:hypothetical protein
MPQTVLEGLFSSRFALPYESVERFSFDTLFGIINNPSCNSIYVSGRPLLQRYQDLLRQRGYAIVTVLRDPYEELAERLLFSQYVARQGRETTLSQRLTGLAPLTDLVRDVDFVDAEAVTKRLHSIAEPQRKAIENPCVRALACSVDERPQLKHVAVALENLASMDLVGLRSRYEDFRSTFDSLIGAEILGEYSLVEMSWVPAMAANLARIAVVNELLELDLALYEYAKEAVESVIGESAERDFVPRPVPSSTNSWLSRIIGG